MSNAACTHLDEIAIRELPPSVEGCEDITAGSRRRRFTVTHASLA
jgi:hypothetical protein